jgi:protein-disulfide isomerase
MKSLIYALMVLTLLLAACSVSGPEAEGSVSPDNSALVEEQVTETSPPIPTDEPQISTPPPAETEMPTPAVIQTATEASEQEAPIEPLTITPLPVATEEPAALVVSGQTDEGAFFLGNPDAPVTVIDYSDFL